MFRSASFIWVFTLVVVVAQISDIIARHVEISDNCDGNDCSYGVERRGSQCVCCMSCERMANRVPLPLKKCPTELKDCGDCMHGYVSKYTFGKQNRYDICTKMKLANSTMPVSRPLKPVTKTNHTSHGAALPWILPTIAIITAIVVCVGFFVYKKNQATKKITSKENVIALNEFHRSPEDEAANNNTAEAEFNSSIKIPEENCETTIPLLANTRAQSTSMIETDAHQQASPIDLAEPNQNATFQSRNPSAPSLVTLSTETDSIPIDDLAADSGQSSLNSGNYSQASTVPIDRLEQTSINNNNNRAVIFDNNPLRFVVHGEATLVVHNYNS